MRYKRVKGISPHGGKKVTVARRRADDGSDFVSFAVIRHARKKPEGVSDARWRMELSRRRSAARGYEYDMPEDCYKMPYFGRGGSYVQMGC